MFNEMPLDLAACLFGPSACMTSSEHISTTVPEISTLGMFPIWDLAFKGLYLGPGGKAFLIDACLNNVIEEFQGLQTGLRRDKSWDDSCVWEYTHDAILSEDEWSNILYLSIEYIYKYYRIWITLNTSIYQLTLHLPEKQTCRLDRLGWSILHPIKQGNIWRWELCCHQLLPTSGQDHQLRRRCFREMQTANEELHKWTIQ